MAGVMSRAFIKETDEPIDDLPDRTISPHPNFVTPEGLALIEATLARLHDDHAAALAADQRPALARIGRDLRYWTARRASAEVVTAPPDPSGVRFGCTVTIARADGRQQTFRIVGEDEADPAQGRLSHASPLARALMGQNVGDEARVGSSDVEILGIA